MVHSRFARYIAFAAAAALWLTGCGPTSALRDLASPPRTAHERYVKALTDAGLHESAMGREWLAAGDSALRVPVRVALPAREIGAYARDEARAVAYRVSLREGERFRATLQAQGRPAQLFFDLYEAVSTGDLGGRHDDHSDSAATFTHVATAATVAPRASTIDSALAALVITHEADRDGDYVLRLQSELLRSGRYEIRMEVEPQLAFPVQGRDNRAIQSLYGVARDGGRREHHGIDIFAARGTPVLAATDGVVRSVSPNALGGNVVWLIDERRAQMLYYAHLDRHAVAAGQAVRTGDTLGYVGNTGNARTTAPHLHFGIYRRGRGPIDPLRHVRLVRDVAPRVTADTARLGRVAYTAAKEAVLRPAPGASDSVLRRLPRSTAMRVVGAASNSYRVQLKDGTAGYLRADAIRDVRK